MKPKHYMCHKMAEQVDEPQTVHVPQDSRASCKKAQTVYVPQNG